MKRSLLYTVVILILLSGCSTIEPLTRMKAYPGMYNEKPMSVLLMPPINRSVNVEAKEYFHSTLNVPIANAGYYVLPPFLSMEILKRESAYDSELFLDAPLDKFREVFGADLAFFTIIHDWNKSGLAAQVYVKVEYIIKSTKTNEVLYSRVGEIVYNTAVNSGSSSAGLLGALVDIAATVINTAVTQCVDVARTCNDYTLQDLPAGQYSPIYGLDAEEEAGEKQFHVVLHSAY